MTLGDQAHIAASLVALLHRVEGLKHLKRSGWVDRGIQEPETVAAHAWRLALLSWLIADLQGLDAARAMRLALVHDLPEVLTGDRTPFDDLAITPQERLALASNPGKATWRTPERQRAKQERERLALDDLFAGLPEHLTTALRVAWEEYEQGASAEARLVGQLDKLEAYVQGREYAASGKLHEPSTLNSFLMDNRLLLTDPLLRAMLHVTEP